MTPPADLTAGPSVVSVGGNYCQPGLPRPDTANGSASISQIFPFNVFFLYFLGIIYKVIHSFLTAIMFLPFLSPNFLYYD